MAPAASLSAAGAGGAGGAGAGITGAGGAPIVFVRPSPVAPVVASTAVIVRLSLATSES